MNKEPNGRAPVERWVRRQRNYGEKMSIHVCKCIHNGREEYHLRYPGMTKSAAQELADEINGGALSLAKTAKETAMKLAEFREAAKDAPGILDLMIRCSETTCPPMHDLLTTDGLYSFHMANLWVRTNGKEYTMEADWADNCGKLVKRMTELLTANAEFSGPL